MSGTTFGVINSEADLNEAISSLFGDNSNWIQRYFGSRSIGEATIGALNAEPSADERQQQAFHQAADEILSSVFSHDFNAVASGEGLEYSAWADALGDTVITAEEYSRIIEEHGGAELHQNLQNMPSHLRAQFDALMVGILNGAADSPEGEEAYSIQELENEGVFPQHVIDEIDPFFVALMNQICGAVPDANIEDFEVAPHTPQNAERLFLGI